MERKFKMKPDSDIANINSGIEKKTEKRLPNRKITKFDFSKLHQITVFTNFPISREIEWWNSRAACLGSCGLFALRLKHDCVLK